MAFFGIKIDSKQRIIQLEILFGVVAPKVSKANDSTESCNILLN